MKLEDLGWEHALLGYVAYSAYKGRNDTDVGSALIVLFVLLLIGGSIYIGYAYSLLVFISYLFLIITVPLFVLTLVVLFKRNIITGILLLVATIMSAVILGNILMIQYGI